MHTNHRSSAQIARAFRRLAAVVLSLLAAAVLLSSGAAQSSVGPANVTPATTDKPVSFRDRLIVGLRALSKSDIDFVDNVVARVQAGQLPQRLVDQTFFWARERAARTPGGRGHRPIVYFRPALTLQAKQLGVTL
jgi:hypothetical protein